MLMCQYTVLEWFTSGLKIYVNTLKRVIRVQYYSIRGREVLLHADTH